MIGALLDQQVPMEWAFTGPYTLMQRLGGDHLDANQIASYDPDAFADLVSTKPAVHRYPGSMADRIQKLCQHLVEHYHGHAQAVWDDAQSGDELRKRLEKIPGFGKQKAQVFVALLGKQRGVRPPGWREAAGPYGKDGSRQSVADVTGPDTLQEVRDTKKRAKEAKKGS